MRLNVMGSVAAVLLLLISHWLRLAEAFGAHPFWSGNVLFLGGTLGIFGASAFAVFGSHIRLLIPLAVFDATFFFGAVAAYLGKIEFAKSYAENTLAGHFWFFGWIAVVAGLSGLIATAARYIRRSEDI